ncbi:16S rRNA (guanine(966)-N(2))-methyltransferase RsmD [Candidatus Pelagibacter communis]|uniref:16S rRNA (guanine(966)-N(2))-methyltransferase RsmD n=1 Tax=Pelagibacter ubique TaxID=198252 RepID=UPI00094D1B2E|nr:16S rRNA (guanine(966)-N(2))-methyltransferase RsmD [Candidatus Pelagibacter ubique]
MRIISGKLKGRQIQFVKSKITRPLKDSVKENIFNILKHSNKIEIQINKAKILDLYSGIGSFGIECISRGAKNVTFVEKEQKIINLLKENLINLSIVKQAKVFNQEIKNTNNFLKYKYDIFFFDPPFKENNFIEILQKISKKKCFNNKHLVIIHREKNTHDKLDEILNVLMTRQYGRSEIIFGKFNLD